MSSRPGLLALLAVLAVLVAPRVAWATSMGGAGVVVLVLLVAAAVAFLGLVTLIGTLVTHRRVRPPLGWIIGSLLTGTLSLAIGGFALWAVPGSSEFLLAGGAALGIGIGNWGVALSALGKRSGQRPAETQGR